MTDPESPTPRITEREAQSDSGLPLSGSQIELDPTEYTRIEQIAARVLRNEPQLNVTYPFGERVRAGIGDGPALLLEDHASIAGQGPQVTPDYGYRALLLASEGDRMIVAGERSSGFETYCRDVLRFGQVEVIAMRTGHAYRSLTAQAIDSKETLHLLAEFARAQGRLTVRPYMGTAQLWVLAGKIAAQSSVEVVVESPPPRLVQRVNDKLWFSRRIDELFGHQARPTGYAAFSLSATIATMRLLARDAAQLVVKLPDSASSVGNFVFSAEEIARGSSAQLARRLSDDLREAHWCGSFPLLVSAWESPLLASPSAQLWIEPDARSVRVEGIFEQNLRGERRVFSGSIPTTLPRSWRARLRTEAASIGYLFQRLGYVGRCSFDAIVVGASLETAALHWIECNGRWGGTSIPMTVANRLFGDHHRRPFTVMEEKNRNGLPLSIREFLKRMDEVVYRPGVRDYGLIILSPRRIESGSGWELMLVGRPDTAILDEAHETLVKLVKMTQRVSR